MTPVTLGRRTWMQGLLAGGAATLLPACATQGAAPARAQVVVVVVGGGWGGATAARYIRLLSDRRIEVVLVEPEASFVSCPGSNLVIGGLRTMADITLPYDGLRRDGVTIVRDRAAAIDAGGRTVRLEGGAVIGYDKLVLSPGVELMFDGIEGLREARADGAILQAWKAGAETLALRRQLEAMRDGGVYAIAVPEAPYRCPPGPYERASLVAAYFKRSKPRSKVLVLDANPDVTSKGALFKKAWADLYAGIIEYRPQHKAVGVDAKRLSVRFEIQDAVQADVLNVLPPMRAGSLAVQSGLALVNRRWCAVDYRSFESAVARDIHVVGDSVLAAAAMPKSGHMANSQAKVAAAAIVAQLGGLDPIEHPMLNNTCYSYVDPDEAVHVASVHEYVAAERTYKPVAGAGGLSAARSELEARYAEAWARNIWADTLGLST